MTGENKVFAPFFRWIEGGWDVEEEMLGIFTEDYLAMAHVAKLTGRRATVWYNKDGRIVSPAHYDGQDGEFRIKIETLNEGYELS